MFHIIVCYYATAQSYRLLCHTELSVVTRQRAFKLLCFFQPMFRFSILPRISLCNNKICTFSRQKKNCDVTEFSHGFVNKISLEDEILSRKNWKFSILWEYYISTKPWKKLIQKNDHFKFLWKLWNYENDEIIFL